MCGIIGVVSNRSSQVDLLQGLKNMEYRGYDSAGICTIENKHLKTSKAVGKLDQLTACLATHEHVGKVGIGHTRWATHGKATVENAHPHSTANVAVVHNGIIENHVKLRRSLEFDAVNFLSHTDTEVIPHLLTKLLQQDQSMKKNIPLLLAQLEGAYALGMLNLATPDELWFARKGSPLLLARGNHGYYIASDGLAVAGVATEMMYLDEGEWGYIHQNGVIIYNQLGDNVTQTHTWQAMPDRLENSGKGGYDHFMLKEIHEQPAIMAHIMDSYASKEGVQFPDATWLSDVVLPDRIVMVACGTSYHAALTARYWLERYLQVSVEVDVASEYRYRDPIIGSNTWLITLSQSGETADTLEALRLFKGKTPDNRTLAICNVPSSSLVRESDGLIALNAGVEIGVASTKAYTAQLAILALLAMKLAVRSGNMSKQAWREHYQAMCNLEENMNDILTCSSDIQKLTPLFSDVHGVLFLGRGPSFPLALEGALKLKEISYLHAEGYPAGEMKHGPIALIDAQLPVIIIAPKQYHLDKVISSLHEVKARGAKVILLTDVKMDDYSDDVESIISLPTGDYFTAPLLAAIPLQLLAYEVAKFKGTDVDQPRNLAKSVTVE
ncbi:MAG: glutamine--fructose-6-phosphate transaminase (isomerizing) [Mariprofundaceae bacterium]|nr:glutamine--fructose-6-phosphate transaminase (isomerizing) [Mariprofundaceae bacterium]